MQARSVEMAAAPPEAQLKDGPVVDEWVLGARKSSIGLKSSVLGLVAPSAC